MKAGRWMAITGAAGLALSFMAGTATAAVSSSPSGRVALKGSAVPAQELAHPSGAVSAKSTVSFDLSLKLRNAAGAEAFVRAVSSPGSKSFHHYLTDAQWLARYGPTKKAASAAESWLKHEGFTGIKVGRERLLVSARGSAAKVEKAFGVKLAMYTVRGHRVRLASGAMSLPASLAGSVSGTVGINQFVATTSLTQNLAAPASKAAAKPAQEPAPPAGFRNPTPCSSYWGQKIDTSDSTSLYAPYTGPLPYDICGYKPSQLRGAYQLAGSIAGGDNGSGVALAIVDAYDSPTPLSDAQEYFKLNDPSNPLKSSQFVNVEPSTVDDQSLCGGSGWYPEQALDVESSHSMAPGATIEFVGATDCLDSSLLTALQTAVTSGASVVSDSWGDTLGDLFTDDTTKTAYDDTFMLADATGVSVLFSSGDDGDNFADFGLDAPDYPASSPFITAVGGTTLEIGKSDNRQAEYGWVTAKQVLCEPASAKTCGSATTPTGSLAFQAGGGGGTSFYYAEPYYQDAVVPSALALRNVNVTGEPARVLPDISMDADAQSGLLIGLTQTFPNGTYYSQFKEGGTSLASPLLAGVIADVDQKAGTALGFLNPVLYKADASSPSAFNDILAPSDPDATAVIRVDYANEVDATDGYIVSLRAIGYAGPETYCDGTGNCATRPYTLTATPGFDSLTGIGSVGAGFIRVLSKF
jgi:subtilase family serine protease